MDLNTFDILVEEARNRQDELLTTKGQDYTQGDPDRLVNFKRWGSKLNITPFQVLGVLMGKHVDSIVAYMAGNALESEPIESRIDDNQNYLHLFEALIKDEAEAKARAKPARKQRRKGGRR